MSELHESSLNLNWLVALDALLATRSVSEAARKVGLTQPAMSRVLGNLRRHFDDALLVRAGRAMVPTPRALQLAAPVSAALESLRQAVAPGQAFSPQTSRRVWALATADYVTATMLPALVQRFALVAPGMSVVVSPLTEATAADLVSGAIDAVLCPQRALGAGVIWSRVLRDDWVAIVRQRHPTIRTRLTLQQLCSTPQVFVAPIGQAHGALDSALAKLGKSRVISMRLPTFLTAPLVVAKTDLLAVVPRRVAQVLGEPLALRTVELPLELAPLVVASGWHERNRKDAAHRWFRRELVALEQSAEG